MKPQLLLSKVNHSLLLLSLLLVALLATACGMLRVEVVTQPTPVARPGVPPSPTPWFGPANYATAAGRVFDDRLRLLGYTVQPQTAESGSRVTVTLIWQVLDVVSAEYNTFVHVLNKEGQLLAQSDHPTGGGWRHSRDWLIDEYIYDQHQLQLPGSMRLADVEIVVGLYDFARGQRADAGVPNTYTLEIEPAPTPYIHVTQSPMPRATSTPLPTEPPAQLETVPQTGVAQVDRAIAAVLSNDVATRRDLIHFTTIGCTQELGMGGPPKCEPGQEEGTPVERFPLLGPGEGQHIAPQDIEHVLDFRVEGLEAVYRRVDTEDRDPYFPAGAFGLVFTTSSTLDEINRVLVHLDEDGRIVRLDFVAWPLDDNFAREVGEWLLPPPPQPTSTPRSE